ncbi:MAG: hypothetical protein C0483_23945 [Pirellula sp.]|nr:hypothetical protein [Pirellula sp.]
MGPAPLEGIALSTKRRCSSLLPFVATTFLASISPGAYSLLRANDAPEQTSLVVVIGAAGEESYGEIFAEEAALWRKTATDSAARLTLIGAADSAGASDAQPTDKERLQSVIAAETSAGARASPLWIVFLGHGTFDGRTAAFNLRGPDVTSAELTDWLGASRRPIAVVNTTAASAPFLTALSAPNRVVITATKTGQERNYARFGRFFAKRVIDPAADLDKDDQTSLFEAFLAAARDTAEYYRSEGRIATEHPLLDDDGDGRGVRVDFFERDKLVKRPAGEAAVDGALARKLHLKPSAADRQLTPAQRAERDRLEAAVAALRAKKATLPEEAYFAELEKLLVALARLNAAPKAVSR